MAGDFLRAEQIVRAEYQRLCNCLGLIPVPLDVYVCDDSTQPSTTTPLGFHVANCDPLYSGTKRLMAVPLTDAEDSWPVTLPSFPPLALLKQSDEWPAWRIELWHEVVHQVSNDVLAAWDPREAPRLRPNTTPSQSGHGQGWFSGVEHVAKKLGVDAEALDAVLDQ
jgi:hypothetical protein